jgi:FtsH-binding integral membrane protein
MQGELYWNGGIVAVVLGALALGAVFGAVARLGVRAGDGPWLLLYALLVAFTHHLLTRALATMFENVIFAVAGTAIAVYALSPERRSLREVLAGARARRTAPGVP